MNRTRWYMKEITRSDGDGIASTRAALEANGSRDYVAVDIMVSVMMPP
jgi:hypothetical protein